MNQPRAGNHLTNCSKGQTLYMLDTRKKAVAGLTAAFILLLASSFYFLYESPTLGITLSWNKASKHYEIASAKPWSQLWSGDVIKRIGDLDIEFDHLLTDNIYIESRARLFSWLEAKRQVFERLKSPDVAILVVRAGKPTEVQVTPRKAGASFLGNAVFLHFIAGAIFFLIGVVVFYKKEPGGGRFLFLVMCLTIMLIFITNATSLMSEIVYQPEYLTLMNLLNLVALPLGNALLLHFCLFLPHKRSFLKKCPWLTPLFYAMCIIIAASFWIPVINILVSLLAALTFISIIHAYFTYREPVERQQMKWVVAGFIFGLGPWLFINGVPMLIAGKRLMPDTVPAAFIVLIPLFMAFAVWKYRLMDIDAFLEGTFAYVVTVLVLGVADLAFLALLGARFSEAHPLDDVFLYLVLVASFYIITRDRIRLLLRKIFRRVVLAEADTIAMLHDRASGLPPDRVLETVVNVIKEAFQPSRVVLAAKGGLEAEETLRSFRGHAGVVNLWEVPEFTRFLSEELYLALVMTKGEQPDAVVLVGGLQHKQFYSGHDLAVLNALLAQAKTLYENAVLYAENIRECTTRLVEEQRHVEEKEMILKDLHDGIGGIAANIHLLSQMALTSSSPEDHRKTLSTITELSKSALFEVESFLQSLDPSDTTLGNLVTELHHMGRTIVGPHGISYKMSSLDTNGSVRVGPLFYLNVLKVQREALTNVVKHAKAKTVRVETSVTDALFTLTVEDDGIGCPPERPGGRGMKNMETRAKRMGGSLTVTSDQGVRIELRIPILDGSLSHSAGEAAEAATAEAPSRSPIFHPNER